MNVKFLSSQNFDVNCKNKYNLVVEIPEKHRDFFHKHIKDSFDFLITKIDLFKLKNQTYLKNYLSSMSSYSPSFLGKITKEIKTLDGNQLELFLEYLDFNSYFSKKANPLFDILRIKKGVLTKKILSSDINSVCKETYTGFIRALRSGTAKVITADIDGKKKTFLVKSFPGNFEKSTLLVRLGTNILALDISNFKIYAFKNFNFLKSEKRKLILKRKGDYFHLQDGFTDYENAKRINKSAKDNPTLKTSSEIIAQIKEIKRLLNEYTSEKTAKRNESFKGAIKDLLKDKKTRKVIKTRFRR